MNPTHVEEIQRLGVISKDRQLCSIQPSAPSSLQLFVPRDLQQQNGEEDDSNVLPRHHHQKAASTTVLSFGTQTLDELNALASSDELFISDGAQKAWSVYKSSGARNIEKVGKTIIQTTGLKTEANDNFAHGYETFAIRRLRQQLQKGTISEDEYETAIDQEIALMISSEFRNIVLPRFFWL